ncbi:glycosyltransferase [Photobacterium leiognathi]|uniref:glycosyltransferase n=1 Tax=Photobacterium leiognathi TaxID=553611 RepID=UPI00298208A3|nr:glycosyltransferase [Photobacterium leiognathi]
MKVTALVTLFYPEISNVINIKELSAQVDRVILLDNTPDKDNSELFFDLNVEYIFNSGNLGLSSAFNEGLRQIKEKTSEFVIFFDQDSTISKGHIRKLIEDFELLSKEYKIGCIGPAYHDSNSNKVIENKDKDYLKDDLYSVQSLITSSLLTKYEILEDISGWNESIFLDYADWDLCWRMKEKNYILVLDSRITLNHSLGDSAVNIGNLSFPKYSPVREYYRIRDSLKLARTNYVPFKYKLKFLYTWLLEPLIYLTLFPNRLLRVKLVLKAFKDAVFNINGSICKY